MFTRDRFFSRDNFANEILESNRKQGDGGMKGFSGRKVEQAFGFGVSGNNLFAAVDDKYAGGEAIT